VDNNELLSQVLAAMQEQTETLTRMVKESESRINVKIENEITKWLDALTDGYKLNHEKQYELERRLETVERRLERLEVAG
jgi:hypothetical protein